MRPTIPGWFVRALGILAVAGASVAVLGAQARGQQAPARSGGSGGGPMPEIVVGGVQVVKVTLSKDDFSAKPFHADNGTAMVLWIKMPAGMGVIKVDEDASLLQSFKDDKGTDLGGKYGSVPEEFEDASGGTITVESSGMPAAGATALLAEGSVAMNVAAGTKPTRIANVRIASDQKFTIGTTPVTLADVKQDDEDLRFTIKLPRQLLMTIKSVKFFDAKNAELEGRRTGTGYMNDAGELDLAVKTTQKTLTLEFEIWQGMRSIKVPFKVKAGLSLG
jgi:hypothetical protein